MGVQEDEVEGVLKLHSKILENHQLKKLDKCEKGLVNAIHLTGKGRSRLLNDINKEKYSLLLDNGLSLPTYRVSRKRRRFAINVNVYLNH